MGVVDLPVGTAVRIHSLVGRPELNGESGVVVTALDTAKGRLGVKLASVPDPIALKPNNLEANPVSAPDGGAEMMAPGGGADNQKGASKRTEAASPASKQKPKESDAMAFIQEQRDQSKEALLTTMMNEMGVSFSKEEDRESAAALMEDAHAITNNYTRATGRRLVDVLKNIEEGDIYFHCFACRAVVSSHRNCCARCKAIMYCSKKCQQRDWKHGPGGGQKPHKHWCPLLQKHMAKLQQTQSLTAYFPWLRLTESGIFPRDQVLSALGLLGEDMGYWSKPSSRASHAAQHLNQKRYGVMLNRPTYPSDEQGWRLPAGDIPRLYALSEQSCPAPLGARVLTSWPEYYQWRGLSPSSLAALLLEFPLTLYFAITQLPRLMCESSITVHLVGAEKELEFLPLFAELAFLLPHTHISIVLFGEELARCRSDAPKGSLARASPLFAYATPPCFDASADHCVTITWEPEHATWQDALRSGAIEPPDLLFAPNAGVAAYPAWKDAIFVAAFAGVTIATSEYCEWSVEMEVDTYKMILQQAQQKGCAVTSTSPKRFLNPFRNPGQRPFPMNLAPNHSNGFCTILDLAEDLIEDRTRHPDTRLP